MSFFTAAGQEMKGPHWRQCQVPTGHKCVTMGGNPTCTQHLKTDTHPTSEFLNIHHLTMPTHTHTHTHTHSVASRLFKEFLRREICDKLLPTPLLTSDDTYCKYNPLQSFIKIAVRLYWAKRCGDDRGLHMVVTIW